MAIKLSPEINLGDFFTHKSVLKQEPKRQLGKLFAATCNKNCDARLFVLGVYTPQNAWDEVSPIDLAVYCSGFIVVSTGFSEAYNEALEKSQEFAKELIAHGAEHHPEKIKLFGACLKYMRTQNHMLPFLAGNEKCHKK